MKALTVWQPWAWAIIHGGKDVENRSWFPPRSLLGQRIAIHSGRTAPGELDCLWVRQNLGLGYGPMPSRDQLKRGVVLGSVVLLGALDGRYTSLSGPGRWSEPGMVWWRLSDPVALATPIPCLGSRGLWDLPAEIEHQMQEAARA